MDNNENISLNTVVNNDSNHLSKKPKKLLKPIIFLLITVGTIAFFANFLSNNGKKSSASSTYAPILASTFDFRYDSDNFYIDQKVEGRVDYKVAYVNEANVLNGFDDSLSGIQTKSYTAGTCSQTNCVISKPKRVVVYAIAPITSTRGMYLETKFCRDETGLFKVDEKLYDDDYPQVSIFDKNTDWINDPNVCIRPELIPTVSPIQSKSIEIPGKISFESSQFTDVIERTINTGSRIFVYRLKRNNNIECKNDDCFRIVNISRVKATDSMTTDTFFLTKACMVDQNIPPEGCDINIYFNPTKVGVTDYDLKIDIKDANDINSETRSIIGFIKGVGIDSSSLVRPPAPSPVEICAPAFVTCFDGSTQYADPSKNCKIAPCPLPSPTRKPSQLTITCPKEVYAGEQFSVNAQYISTDGNLATIPPVYWKAVSDFGTIETYTTTEWLQKFTSPTTVTYSASVVDASSNTCITVVKDKPISIEPVITPIIEPVITVEPKPTKQPPVVTPTKSLVTPSLQKESLVVSCPKNVSVGSFFNVNADYTDSQGKLSVPSKVFWKVVAPVEGVGFEEERNGILILQAKPLIGILDSLDMTFTATYNGITSPECITNIKNVEQVSSSVNTVSSQPVVIRIPTVTLPSVTPTPIGPVYYRDPAAGRTPNSSPGYCADGFFSDPPCDEGDQNVDGWQGNNNCNCGFFGCGGHWCLDYTRIDPR